MNLEEIRELAASQGHKRAIDQRFYSDADIYRHEIDRIFLNCWMYAGHISEIPNVGDWHLFEIASESVIIVRSDENTVSALVNVCRHRGSRVRSESSGCSRRFTCPYHGWTYGLDGRLLVAAHMDEQFDKSSHNLKTVNCELLAGMIFINFSENPAPFSIFKNELSDCIAPYDLENAKVAHREEYPIKANWKLSVENYTECYHCAPSHPEYSQGHSLARPWEHSAELMDAANEKRPACGLSTTSFRKFGLDAPAFGADVSYESYPLWNGHLTGSKDGKPVAPLLGSISDYDGSATDMHLGPVTFTLNYCDHVVIYRFAPVSIDHSVCDITWLVRGDAVEGRDYDKKELTWLWDVTTAADKRIIEANARGVASAMYEPGPLSNMEDYLRRFLEWYLHTMQQAEPDMSMASEEGQAA